MAHTQQRPDLEVKMLVMEALAREQGLDDTLLGVSVDAGAVILSGQVASYPAKLRAEKAVLRVRGVDVLDDDITVETGIQVSDMDIAIAASRALHQAVNIPEDSVRAVVTDHVVTLSGAVPWDFQRAAAERAVSHLMGVRMVIDNIKVTPDIAPVEIRVAIMAALNRSALLRDRPITVQADGGAITLEGTVHSWHESREALAAAWSAPGVRSVTNHLHTAYWGQAAMLA